MTLEETLDSSRLAEITADIISAFVANNSVRPADLPAIINEVYAALFALQSGPKAAPLEPVEPERPAVPIKKSITPDYLISLEDGKHYRTLKRHLSGLGMSPLEYRAKWGLPKEYPMVAPTYAAKRSELAKKIGLGRKPLVQAVAPTAEPEPAAQPKKRGRKSKVSAA